MKKIFLLPLSMLLLFSCASGYNQKQESIITIDLKGLLQKQPVELDLNIISENIRMIPLQMTDSSLIKTIRFLMYDEQSICLYNEGHFLLFDPDGNYISSFGHIGEDPTGFLGIESAFEMDKEIHLYDNSKGRIFKYDKYGSYKNQIKVPHAFETIFPVNEEIYAGYIPKITGLESIRIGYFDKQGLMLDSIPYEYQVQHTYATYFYFNEGVFIKGYKRNLFKEIFRDTIYSIGENLFIPLYSIDLGGKTANPNAREEMKSPLDNIFNDMFRTIIKGESERYLFLDVLDIEGQIIYDKKEKISRLCKIIFGNESLEYTIHNTNAGTYLISEYWEDETENNPILIVSLLKR